MELKVLVKVGLLLFLMGFTPTVDARFDPSSFITQLIPNGDANNYYVKSTTTACCDKCVCYEDELDPPQCHCEDVGTRCHSECEVCRCDFSWPPRCLCMDNTAFCYDKCSSSEAKTHQE